MQKTYIGCATGWRLGKILPIFPPVLASCVQNFTPTTRDIERVIFPSKLIYNKNAKGSHTRCKSGGTLLEIWMRVHPTSESVSHRYNSQQYLPSFSDCSCTCFQVVVLRRHVKAKPDKRQKTAGGSCTVECNPVACPLAR